MDRLRYESSSLSQVIVFTCVYCTLFAKEKIIYFLFLFHNRERFIRTNARTRNNIIRSTLLIVFQILLLPRWIVSISHIGKRKVLLIDEHTT